MDSTIHILLFLQNFTYLEKEGF